MLCQDRRATTSSYPSALVAHRLASEILQLGLVYVGLVAEGLVHVPTHLSRDLVLPPCEVVHDLLVHLKVLLVRLLVLVLAEVLVVVEVARAQDQDQLGCLL